VGFHHVVKERVICVRSRGSKVRFIIARIHGLPRIWQQSLEMKPYYIIEVISENYDGLDKDDRERRSFMSCCTSLKDSEVDSDTIRVGLPGEKLTAYTLFCWKNAEKVSKCTEK